MDAVTWASRRDDLKEGSVLRLLLEHGADINGRSKSGKTPLHWGSYYGALEAVRLLVEHDADVEAKDNDGKTALQLAHGDKAVKLLREHGAN